MSVPARASAPARFRELACRNCARWIASAERVGLLLTVSATTNSGGIALSQVTTRALTVTLATANTGAVTINTATAGTPNVNDLNINGRVTNIAIDPNNNQRFFASTVGGVWRSRDGARRWENPLDRGLNGRARP